MFLFRILRMIFRRSRMKLFIFLIICLLPAQITIYFLFPWRKPVSQAILIGIGFGECETHILYSFLHSMVSDQITFQGVPACHGWNLTKKELTYLDQYTYPHCGQIGEVIGDVSICNIKYAEYLLNNCDKVKIIVTSNGEERDMQSIRKWILSFNDFPWSKTSTHTKQQACFPHLEYKKIQFSSFNDLIRIFYDKYREIIDRIKTKYKHNVIEISSDVLSNGIQNLTTSFGMNYKAQGWVCRETNWVYPGDSRYCNVDRTAVVLHAPHGTPNRLASMSYLVKKSASLIQTTYTCPPNLLYIFVDNQDKLPLLKRSVISQGCRYVHLGLDLKGWSWAAKIQPVLEFLQNSNISNDTYIISSDAGDSALVGDPANLIEKFLSYKTEILLMTRPYDWPVGLVRETTFENQVYANISRCNMHPCAGGWMARKDSAQKYLRLMSESYSSSPRGWDDAQEWRRLHFNHYPKIQTDVYERIFARTDMTSTCLMPHA